MYPISFQKMGQCSILRKRCPLELTFLRKEHKSAIGYKNENEEVARNPNTPLEILERLSKDKDEDVRWGVARNLNTPLEILEKLSKDKDEEVVKAVFKNMDRLANEIKNIENNTVNR